MTYIDFQIDAARFLAAQRSYLRRLALCPPALPAVSGVRVVIDRIDIGPSSLRHNEEATFDVWYVEQADVKGEKDAAKGFRTVLAQQLTLQMTTDADIRSNPNADPPLIPWQLTVLYELSAFALDDDCYLKATPLKVEFGPLPPLPVVLPPAVVALLESYLSGQLRLFAPGGTVPMGLDALDLPTGFLNAGLTVDTTGTTLAIRVEIRASQDLRWAAWQNFYSGHIVDRREGRDWALFVPAAYINHRITSELWQNLPRDDDLEAYPGASYVALPDRARFDVDVLLIYHAVQVDELDLDITVSADPRVQVSVWVDTVNRLSAEIDFAGLVSPVGALSTLAVAIVDAFGIPARSILYRIVGSAIVGALSGQPVTSVTQPTPSTVRVDKDVVIPGIAGVAHATITDLLAHEDGIALVGEFKVNEPSNAVVDILGVSQFAKRVPNISCGAASLALVALFGQDPDQFAILHAGASLGNLGTAPLHMCGAPQLVRPDAPVQPQHIRVDEVGLPIDVSIDIGRPPPAYYAPPFAIEMIVRTNGGTRLIRLDPPPVVSQADLDRLQAEVLVKIGDCQQLVDPWLRTHRGYNPRWSPRPPEGLDVLHHWEVVVSGLPEDERVELRSADDRAIASAPGAGRDGTARVAVVVAPTEGEREVSIVRVGAVHDIQRDVADREGRTRGLEVRQTDLVVLGDVPLSEPTHGIGLVELPQGPAVVALLSDRVEGFDVGPRASAGSIASWPGRFHGVLRASGALLLYGADGVAQLDRSGRLRSTSIDEPVIDAATGPNGVYLVTPARVLQLSSDLRPIGESSRPEVACVGSLGTTLLLGHAAGVEEADEAMTVRATRESRSLPPARLLQDGSSLRRQGVLAMWQDGTAGVLQDRRGKVVEVARYASRPLLAGAVRIGDRLVVAAEHGNNLRVLRIGRQVVL